MSLLLDFSNARKVLFFLCLALLFSFQVEFVHAQGSGVGISPAIIEETLDPGKTTDYKIKVTNLNQFEQTFYVFVRNISGVDDNGTPIFAKDSDERTGFELADWVTIASTSKVITLPAQGSQGVEFTLNVPEDASPGSHFGGLFVSVEAPEMQKTGAAVGYQVASILSMRINGEIREEANIREFSTGSYLYGSENIDFSVRIENLGNVLVRPRGPLEVYNMLGKKVGTVMFNEEKRGVFPGSSREFKNIVWQGDSIGFGRYEAVLSANYGEEGQGVKTMSNTATFWILPMNIIWPALIGLAIILGIIFFAVRIYIQRSLEQYNHGRRMVRRPRRRNSSATLLLVVVMLTVTALFLIVLLAIFA